MQEPTTSTPPQKAKKGDLVDSWWGKIIFSLIMVGITYYLHLIFTDLETGAVDSVRMNWIIALVYNILGHIPAVILLGLLGLGFFIAGIWQWIRERG